MDFTLRKYGELLRALTAAGYEFYTLEQYLMARSELGNKKVVILRHDVDKRPDNALIMAELESQMEIQSSYYFRVVRESNHPSLIHTIADLDHEIGYHYEDMSICNGNADEAIHHFVKWLDYFRNFYYVRTICMHGAPTSKFDSRSLWRKYNYSDYGVIGEPYFDIDYSQFLYLTDTGRCWDGYKVSVRDKIPQYQNDWISRGWAFHSTDDIIRAIKEGRLPDKILITTHPQRWTDNIVEWTVEYVWQSLKNMIKRIIIKKRFA